MNIISRQQWLSQIAAFKTLRDSPQYLELAETNASPTKSLKESVVTTRNLREYATFAYIIGLKCQLTISTLFFNTHTLVCHKRTGECVYVYRLYINLYPL